MGGGPVRSMVGRRARSRSGRARTGKAVLGVLIVAWSLAPIYWGLVVSLSTPVGLESVPPSPIPRPLTLQFYSQILNGTTAVSTTFLSAARNSVVEAVGTTLVTLIVAVLAGYAFGRFRFRGSNVIFVAIIATMALPVYAILIPLYVMLTGAGQIDTYQGIVVILVSANLPLAIWLLRSHISSLPPDIEGAALIDGASRFTLLWRIVVPLVAPGMAAVGVLVFLASWAAFLVPLTFAPTINAQPLTVLITQYTSHFSVDFGLQAAAGMIALIPPILVVAWLNRYLLKGLLKGAGSH